jgi:integrase
MASKLTDLAVEKRGHDPTKRIEIADAGAPGLYLVIQPSGLKSWALRYRAAGKSTKFSIGGYPAVSLRAAREAARVALGKVNAGKDPAAERREARAAAQKPKPEHDLVEKVVETFVERYAKANLRESSYYETKRVLNREVVGLWRGKRLSEIRRADVHALLDGIVDRGSPIMANRTLAALRRMCGWAMERGLIDASPCDKVKAPAAERSRDRVLSDDELRTAWQACDAIGWPFGPLVKLLLLTGQRRDEVAEMRWSEIDMEARTWTLPRERVKNDQAHLVPLSEPAIAILHTLPEIKSKVGYVFTTTGETPVSGFARIKERIDAKMLAALRKDASEPDKIELPPWTLHDLRRTLATGMQKLGARLEVTEAVLNHVAGSRAGIVGIYQRHDWAKEKAEALEAWGRYVEGLAEDTPANAPAAPVESAIA